MDEDLFSKNRLSLLEKSAPLCRYAIVHVREGEERDNRGRSLSFSSPIVVSFFQSPLAFAGHFDRTLVHDEAAHTFFGMLIECELKVRQLSSKTTREKFSTLMKIN